MVRSKEEILEYGREYHKNNREELLAKQREYYKVTKGASQKKYYKNNKEKCIKVRQEYQKNLREVNPVHALYINLKSAAKQKKLEFSIDESDIRVPIMCPIMQIPLKFNNKVHKNDSPSVDRIDTSKGYIKGNIAVISYKANTCKNNLTLEEVRRLLQYMEQSH